MASNARYERAPTRDSFEDQQYTQAPPSYQATAVPDPAPRTEGDNLPDDFKVSRRVIIEEHGLWTCTDLPLVRWHCCRRNHRHSNAVRPQGLLDSVCPLSSHYPENTKTKSYTGTAN